MQSSYNRIKKSILAFSQAHPLINSFGTGNPLELHSANILSFKKEGKEHINYPLVFINIDRCRSEGSSLIYTISLNIMDRVENAAKYAGGRELNDFNQDIIDEVVSDCILIAGDFINHYFNDGDEGLIITENNNIQPFFDIQNDVLAGCNLSLDFTLGFGRSICSLPTFILPYAVYFGVSESSSVDLSEAIPSAYVRDLSSYGVDYNSNGYLYLAIPDAAGVTYLNWYNSNINRGEIGAGELFTTEAIEINGDPYTLYITNYETTGRFINFS